MPEEYLEQVIKNAGMTYTATAQHALQSVLLQINQNKQTEKLSPCFFPPIVWASICANAQRTRLRKWSPKSKGRLLYIWTSPTTWFTTSLHRSLCQHSTGCSGWWQAAFVSTSHHLRHILSTASGIVQCHGNILKSQVTHRFGPWSFVRTKNKISWVKWLILVTLCYQKERSHSFLALTCIALSSPCIIPSIN